MPLTLTVVRWRRNINNAAVPACANHMANVDNINAGRHVPYNGARRSVFARLSYERQPYNAVALAVSTSV